VALSCRALLKRQGLVTPRASVPKHPSVMANCRRVPDAAPRQRRSGQLRAKPVLLRLTGKPSSPAALALTKCLQQAQQRSHKSGDQVISRSIPQESSLLEAAVARISSASLWPFSHVEHFSRFAEAAKMLGLSYMTLVLYCPRHAGACHDLLVGSPEREDLTRLKAVGRWRTGKASRALAFANLVPSRVIAYGGRLRTNIFGILAGTMQVPEVM
jgi:hypothetical protein